MWFCLNVLEGGAWRDYLAAGFVTGMAVATKYTAVIFVVPIVLTHLEGIQWRVRGLQQHARLLGSGVAVLGGAFLGSPFLFLDFGKALSDIAHEARPTHLSGTGEGFVRDLIWYLQGPLPNALSWPGLVLVGLGILWFLSSGRKEGRLAATTPVLFLLFISCHSLRWERWIVAGIPFFCIPLARAITVVTSWVRQRVSAGLGPWLRLGLLLLVATPLLRADVMHGRALTRGDTRTLAGEWMLAKIPPGSRVLMEAYTPQLPKDAFTFFIVGDDGSLVRPDPDKARHRLFLPSGSIGRLRDESVLVEERIQYVVMSNRYDRYLAEEEQYPGIVDVYRRIALNARPIYEISGYTAGSVYHVGGPRIRIYQIE
jgi:hypothetical protein